MFMSKIKNDVVFQVYFSNFDDSEENESGITDLDLELTLLRHKVCSRTKSVTPDSSSSEFILFVKKNMSDVCLCPFEN